jgi:hypothetical protein
VKGKETTSSYRQIDVRIWQRRGLLVVGGSFAFDRWKVEVITSMRRAKSRSSFASGLVVRAA